MPVENPEPVESIGSTEGLVWRAKPLIARALSDVEPVKDGSPSSDTPAGDAPSEPQPVPESENPGDSTSPPEGGDSDAPPEGGGDDVPAAPGEDEEPVPPPLNQAQLLLAIEASQTVNRNLRAILESMRSSDLDSADSADNAKQAMRQLQQVWPTLQNFSVERLAWESASQTYQAATEAKTQVEAAGGSAVAAQAAADAVTQAAFGMSYVELAAWLDANPPPDNTSQLPDLPELSDEMIDQIVQALPDNTSVLDEAIALIDAQIADTDARLYQYQTGAFEGSGDLFLLDLLHDNLANGRRLLGLLGPILDGVKSTIDELGATLAQARGALEMGLNAIGAAFAKLNEQERGLSDTLAELKERRDALAKQFDELVTLRTDVDSYERLRSRFNRARATLLADERIGTLVDEGGELFSASDTALTKARSRLAFSHDQRIVIAWLTVGGSILGLFAVLGAFEKPKYRFVWLPILLCLAVLGSAEYLSWQLGRGLLYSAAGTAIFALLLLPLSIPPKKKKP